MKGFISLFLPKAFLSLAGHQLRFTATGYFSGSIVAQPYLEICLPSLFQGICSSKTPGTVPLLEATLLSYL